MKIMFEKVNPAHPDKVADRIAGALVDYAYTQEKNPHIAVEVLIGHGTCHVVAETSVQIPSNFVEETVHRIAGVNIASNYVEVPQDAHLAANQAAKIRCGDNGIFKGVPVTDEQIVLTALARSIYARYHCDGKYILDGPRLISSYLTIEEREGGKVPVALWAVTETDEAALDRYEGFPNFYYKREMRVRYKGIRSGKYRTVNAFVYIMHEDRPIGIPSDLYMRTCLKGYDTFGFDENILLDAYDRCVEATEDEE